MTNTNWETFRDYAYYDMWCVREAGERRFGHGFHLVNGDEAHGLCDLLSKQADRIEALEAENERLRGVLEVVWKEATTMRNASKLVGPYPKDPASNRVWARSMYHAGKKLHELIKPIRAALGEKQ